MSTVYDLLKTGAARLEAARVPDPVWDAETLLSQVLSLPRLVMKIEKSRLVSARDEAAFSALIARREKREPLQYILGVQCFMGLDIKTDPRALIPRFDSETLCEAALCFVRPGDRVLDLCTGTGALALAVKARCPAASVFASDLSPDALALARENAERLKLSVTFLEGDLWDAVPDGRFHIILSNPPYIPDAEKPRLQKEVSFEPDMALFGGADGLDFYRRIIAGAPRRLLPGGRLFLEAGDGEADAIAALLQPSFTEIRILNDLEHLPRAIAAKWTGNNL